jgi:hypothetical protein
LFPDDEQLLTTASSENMHTRVRTELAMGPRKAACVRGVLKVRRCLARTDVHRKKIEGRETKSLRLKTARPLGIHGFLLQNVGGDDGSKVRIIWGKAGIYQVAHQKAVGAADHGRRCAGAPESSKIVSGRG